jgi:Cu(I)/Ag(I) efflux system membrane fusion protein
MLAGKNGRYSPAEVRIGAEVNGQTEILAGLTAGEKIVASGQFLIDSEASLSGVVARPIAQ